MMEEGYSKAGSTNLPKIDSDMNMIMLSGMFINKIFDNYKLL